MRPSPLYRNDGRGRFADVAEEVGLDARLQGMGVAVGDVDGDAHQDVFLSAVGPNALYRFDGSRYRDATAEAGVAGDPEEWSTSAAFFDADRDGDLDLFVGNYVRWSRAIDLAVDYRLVGVGRAYGPPTNFEARHSYYYRNEGGGRFAERSAEAGLRALNPATGGPVGKTLGLAPADVDGDGWMDLFVANDTVQNFLFHNRGDGTFEEIGSLSGVAYGRDGNATGAMGADSGLYRDDGQLGFAVGNFSGEMTSLFVAQAGRSHYTDEAIVEGIGSPSRLSLSFGLFFFDYDLDGRLDLLQANGHLEEEIHTVQLSQHYRQPAQLFWNAGPEHRATFAAVPAETTGDLSRPIVGRGSSYADVDGDGDLDVILMQSHGAPLLLRNDQLTGHAWLRVRVEDPPGGTAIGAWVEVTADGHLQRRQVMPTRSYLSQVERTLTFGLGPAARVESVRVTWPDGVERELLAVEPNGELSVDRP